VEKAIGGVVVMPVGPDEAKVSMVFSVFFIPDGDEDLEERARTIAWMHSRLSGVESLLPHEDAVVLGNITHKLMGGEPHERGEDV
jgi:hypothetical protein